MSKRTVLRKHAFVNRRVWGNLASISCTYTACGYTLTPGNTICKYMSLRLIRLKAISLDYIEWSEYLPRIHSIFLRCFLTTKTLPSQNVSFPLHLAFDWHLLTWEPLRMNPSSQLKIILFGKVVCVPIDDPLVGTASALQSLAEDRWKDDQTKSFRLKLQWAKLINKAKLLHTSNLNFLDIKSKSSKCLKGDSNENRFPQIRLLKTTSSISSLSDQSKNRTQACKRSRRTRNRLFTKKIYNFKKITIK